MSRLWQTGAELNSLETSAQTGSPTVSSTQARSGQYAIRTNGTDGFAYVHTDDLTQIRSAGALYHAGRKESGDTPYLLCLSDDATPILSLVWDADGGSVRAYAGSRAGTQLAAASDALLAPTAAWRHFGVDVKLAPAGWISLYIDGLLVLSFSGDTTGAGVSFDTVWYGTPGTTDGGAEWADYVYWDDLYIDAGDEPAPDRPYDLQLRLLVPDGDVAAAWLGSDSNSVDNYALVSELAPATATYVSMPAVPADTVDRYTLSGVVVPEGDTIYAVIPLVLGQQLNYPADFQVVLHLAEDADAIGLALGESYQMATARRTTNPSGFPWSATDLADLELELHGAPWA